MAAAAGTRSIAAFLTNPLDVETKLMIVDADYASSSFGECLWSTVEAHGWPGLFCGVEARVAWIVPFVDIYLSLYDTLNEQLLKRHDDDTSLSLTKRSFSNSSPWSEYLVCAKGERKPTKKRRNASQIDGS